MVSEDAAANPGRLYPASNACVNALVLTPEVTWSSIFQFVLERSSFCVNSMRFRK